MKLSGHMSLRRYLYLYLLSIDASFMKTVSFSTQILFYLHFEDTYDMWPDTFEKPLSSAFF